MDRDALERLLAGRWGDVKAATRGLMADPRFWRDETLGMDEHRARVLDQMRGLAEAGAASRGFPATLPGGEGDAGAGVAAFEDLLLGDASLQVKAGVQWGLFASAILHLGTADHHARLLPAAASFDVPGVFAMTETGHGSDVAHLATTATYDPATGMFDLHTPHRAAWKDYLGNAALHGRAAVVFAQLIVGGTSHGVHAFYVPIRDQDGNLLPGVTAADDGHKGGLNGIDNGQLAFDHVAVPRQDLLDRYGHVAADGTYTSPIVSPGRRFFTMLSTLVQGRVFLVGASRSASQLALTIAVRYALARRQFAFLDPGEETRLLDFDEHQRRLLPRLAGTYALTFLAEDLLDRFDKVFTPALPRPDGSRRDPDPTAMAELETVAAAVKPWATWHALDVLQASREACGGAGYMAANRLVGLRADLDIYATFEGDNTVLLQLAARRLLDDYGRDVKAHGLLGVLAVAGSRLREAVWFRSGLARAAQIVADAVFSRTRVGVRVLAPSSVHRLLAGRVAAQTAHLARVLAPARRLDPAAAGRLVNRHQHQLVELGRAYGDLLAYDAFAARVDDLVWHHDDEPEHAATIDALAGMRDLFAASLLERGIGWFAGYGRLSARRVRAVTARIDDVLLGQVRVHAGELVDAFGLRDEHLRAPLLGIPAGR